MQQHCTDQQLKWGGGGGGRGGGAGTAIWAAIGLLRRLLLPQAGEGGRVGEVGQNGERAPSTTTNATAGTPTCYRIESRDELTEKLMPPRPQCQVVDKLQGVCVCGGGGGGGRRGPFTTRARSIGVWLLFAWVHGRMDI